MALSNQFKRFGILVEDIFRHAADGFRATPRALSKAEYKARIDATPSRVTQAASKWFVQEPAKAALWVISKPLELGMAVVNGGVGLISKAFKAAPKTMIALSALGGALGISRLVNGSAEERTQREMQAKMNTLQMMQMQAAQGQQSYMNTATEADMAAMQARTKAQNENAPSSFAETARPDGKAANFTSAATQPASSVSTPAV